MAFWTQVGVVIFQLSSSADFLLGQLTRTVIVVGLRDGKAVDSSDDSSGAFRSTVLRASPVSFRTGREISVIQETVVVKLIATMSWRYVSNVLVSLLRRIERSFDVERFNDVTLKGNGRKFVSLSFSSFILSQNIFLFMYTNFISKLLIFFYFLRLVVRLRLKLK